MDMPINESPKLSAGFLKRWRASLHKASPFRNSAAAGSSRKERLFLKLPDGDHPVFVAFVAKPKIRILFLCAV